MKNKISIYLKDNSTIYYNVVSIQYDNKFAYFRQLNQRKTKLIKVFLESIEMII